MRAARWHGPRDVRVEMIPDPAPGPRDVLVRVDWCGICGTDVDEYLSGPHWIPTDHPNPLTGARAPLTLGHEFAGEVVAIGGEVREFRVGDRVAPDTLIYCGRCYWCRRHQVHLCAHLAALGLMADGGLADYCVAPAAMCVRLPDALPSDHAALAETLAVGVHALRRGRLAPSETVAVVGAGAVGVPLGSADAPESCSFRALVSIDSLPLSRPKAVKSAETARIYAPQLKAFRP